MKSRNSWLWLAVGLSLPLAVAAAKTPTDTDHDGIPDQQERVLGTDPRHPERLRVVLRDGPEPQSRRQAGYDPTKDVVQVECAHVGDDRTLWKVTLAAPPKLANTVLHLYVDADADPTTGRKGSKGSPVTGTDYMLSVIGGRASSTHYLPDGSTDTGPVPTYAVVGNCVLLTADLPLSHRAGSLRYGLYVLCHTLPDPKTKKAAMTDGTAKVLVSGVRLSRRPKILRPFDYTKNFRMVATFGHRELLRVERDEQNVVVPCDQLKRDGFVVDLSCVRRWLNLKRQRPDARAWTTAPKGTYYVGFMLYDDANQDKVALLVDGQLQGVAVANNDNNTTWLFCSEKPFAFRGGEKVELQAVGRSGKHGICNIVFLKERPAARQVEYAVENLTAATFVDQPGRVVVSWTTTWPCPTRFQWGTDTRYGQEVRQEEPCLVHRVVLDGLKPGRTYHGRAVGTRRDGSTYTSDDFVFRADPPSPPPTQEQTTSVPLTVANTLSVDAVNWPVTSGVPVPQGKLADADHVRLLDPDDRPVPLQVKVTGRWPDGSVKWLLVSFLCDVEAGRTATYRLQFGRSVQPTANETPLRVEQTAEGVRVDTGRLSFRVDRHGNLVDFRTSSQHSLASDGPCRTTVRDAAGQLYDTAHEAAEVTVEESGPVRAVVRTVTPLRDADGRPLFQIEKRVEAFAGSAFVRIRHTLVFTNPRAEFTDVESVQFHVPLRRSGRKWLVATAGGEPLVLDQQTQHVWQRTDRECVVEGRGKDGVSTRRLVGSAWPDSSDGPAVALRDFWQNYPKGFRLDRDELVVELCPDFDKGFYDQFPFEKEGHHLFYYLLDGHYRFKTGVSKTHELLLCFEPRERREAVCRLFQQPLLATAPAQWYADSKAFYDLAPRDPSRFPLYEQAIDENLKRYVQRRERQRDYGMLNYGDWYGERGSNWGNIEYDTQHALLLQYVRSGDPLAFFLGEAAELHNRDVDTVHWSNDRRQVGAVYVHQMCHVGGYYKKSVPGTLGFPRAGFTVSHAWVEGHLDYYFLTGDPRSLETARAVADFFVHKELGRPYDFSSTRVPGWHLIMLAAAYNATGDPYYLNAARVVVQRVLETQDVLPRALPPHQREGRKPFQQGGWSRMMVPGHCKCEPRHRGNAGFMVAILLSGLKYYHDITGDRRVKQALIQGAHYLLDETYSDKVHGFRYTSCPKTEYRPGATPLMVEGVARAYLWTRDERFRRVLVEALPLAAGGSSYGKSFSMYYRCGPRVLADLAETGLRLTEPKRAKED